MIKLVVCDLDGTIFGRDLQLPSEAYSFGDVLRSKGIELSIATGRSPSFIEDIVENMAINIPYVTSNGAMICCDKKVIWEKQFSLDPLHELIKQSLKLGFGINFTYNGIDYINRRTDWFKREEQCRRREYNLIEDDSVFDKLHWAEKLSIVDESNDGSIRKIDSFYSRNEDYAYVCYGNQCIEFMANGVNKSFGIAKLSELTGFSHDDILVIGDDENDIEMFKYAGFSAAVGNATENAKACALYKCANDKFDGVLEAVNHFSKE